MSQQLLDVAVQWFTPQFEEKFETDWCKPECQLAQQSSLTPSSIKVHWYLTLYLTQAAAPACLHLYSELLDMLPL